MARTLDFRPAGVVTLLPASAEAGVRIAEEISRELGFTTVKVKTHADIRHIS